MEDFFKKYPAELATNGYCKLNLKNSFPTTEGKLIFDLLSKNQQRSAYKSKYETLAFHWKEDWANISGGTDSFFGEGFTEKFIVDAAKAEGILNEVVGRTLSKQILDFCLNIKNLTVSSHKQAGYSDLLLSRVILRQLDEGKEVEYAANWHEDIGYENKPLRQYLSVIITPYGNPTASRREDVSIDVGDLVIMNAYHRRKDLGISDQVAVIHKGPSVGPKLFFFFEFMIEN